MPGKRLSHYEIIGSLGAGGMGEVHRARDSRLDRDVALKVLPAELARDPERLARLQREAKTLASLQHPNLATVYDFGQEDDVSYLVMELVEGEDLQQRLQRGAVTLEQACEIALQTARGLEAAHAGNVVHRDLKPANIRLATDGTVKILDFGLARTDQPESHDTSFENSPTITAAFTQMGTILGTAAYMSPEQARGQVVDARADIWAFGVVLFELLSGRQIFGGETISDTLAGVLRADPPWEELPSSTPRSLKRLLRRCLERDPSRRLQAIGEARILLEDLAAGEEPEPVPSVAPRPRVLWPWLIALASIAAAVFLWFSRPEPQKVLRTQADLLSGEGVGYDVSDLNLALSPDGTQLAFSGLDESGSRWIYVRHLGTGEPRRLDGTQDGELPFWSPDGDRVGFFVATSLCTIGLADGIVERDIARSSSWAHDLAWHPDGWIALVSNEASGEVYKILPSGGEPEIIYEMDETVDKEFILTHPSFLPDGSLTVSMDPMDGSEDAGTYLLEDGKATMMIPRASNAQWVDGGHVVFRIEQRIFAQRFDVGSRQLLGEPVRIGGPVRSMTFPDQAFMTVAREGTLVYLEGQAGASDSELVWVDRQGQLIERLDFAGDLYPVRISHDGRRVALDVSVRETAGDIWVYDLGRRSSVQYTDDRVDESAPMWSIDDETIYFFRSNNLYRLDLAGAPTISAMKEDDVFRRPQDVHPTSDALLISRIGSQDRDLWLMDPTTGDEELWLELPGMQRLARFSPDGNWVAYENVDRDGSHIWVEQFPDRRERFRISDERGGSHPVWRWDGTEIYFTSRSRKMMAVRVDMDATDSNPVGEPEELFPIRLRRNFYFDVGPQPDRFLLNQLTGEAAVPSAVVVRGWSLED